LHEDDIETLKAEEEYVAERYQAVARALAPRPFSLPWEAAAGMIQRSLRHFRRIVKRFREEGIHGLRHRSRRPKTSPNRTPGDVEEMVLAVREATGFGPNHVAHLVNESLEREGRDDRISPSSVYNILV
jgi:hypothetical protein